ncbi:TetR/AcrR family transcriptional regulator, transcriptional repressor for nem operon [Methylomarinovum caldicuralii]|uniref:TetR/AcrR family transcriptional regulator, transcriptional repressor for nem operon n=1 Tax=Methylomarinovum caldicuralii TaxID=438856 RepID=A0AAU9CVW9_9GAMM|nr:TetR/AcrR family transcriptional regulator [Methylomarinovum caldicuralii]BCX82087.1 TetR/AcrR family transcriptional regulator, transcriptional repressor for nem operon [Methylomarinovum caldicuralii]
MKATTHKEAKKRQLLDEGLRLLLARGYHGTGLQEILSRAGIPKGSFYNYFPSKEAFSAAVIEHYIEPFIQQLDHHLGQNAATPLQALQDYFRALIEELQGNDFKGGCLLGNLMGEVGDTSELCRQALRRALHRYRDKIAAMLAQAQAAGFVRRDRTAEELADCIVDNWQGALLRMKVERSNAPLERFMNQIFRELLPGEAAGPRTGLHPASSET